MIKYINRDALVHTLMDKDFYPVIVRNAIEATTVTDVAPIIHAHWIRTVDVDGTRQQSCSNCKHTRWGLIKAKYCSYCGALMDEGEYEK